MSGQVKRSLTHCRQCGVQIQKPYGMIVLFCSERCERIHDAMAVNCVEP